MKQILEILWIDYGLSKEEIKNAYLKKAMEFHPDRNNWDNDKMIFLNYAYDYIIENYDLYINKKEEDKNSYVNFYNEWLYICYILEDYEQALDKVEKSLSLNNSFKNWLFLKWYCLYRLWKYKDSFKLISKLFEDNPRNNTYYNLLVSILNNLLDESDKEKYKKIYENNIKKSWKNLSEKIKESGYVNIYNNIDKDLLQSLEKIKNNIPLEEDELNNLKIPAFLRK